MEARVRAGELAGSMYGVVDAKTGRGGRRAGPLVRP